MIGYQRLAEQHIREHQARQQKLEEVDALEFAKRPLQSGDFASSIKNWRLDSVSQAGPMGILDVVAQDLESFVELFEHAPKCESKPRLRHRGSIHIL